VSLHHYILKNLLGQGKLDFSPNASPLLRGIGLQNALVNLLTNIDNAEEMTQALNDIGGIDHLLAKLTARPKVTELIEHLFSLGENQDPLIFDIVRKSNQTDPAFAASFDSLLQDAKFQSLGREERLAVLCQVSNYPDTEVVNNLTRLIQKEWFTDSSLEDKQRSLKAIASLTVYPGDEAIIDNTLDRILAPSSDYTLIWENLIGLYGYRSNDKITLNRNYLSADNSQADFSDSKVKHTIAHTIAHEVSHAVNGDRSSKTYEYFLEEYRAYYVGFTAEYGRVPTRAEMAKRVLIFVEDNDVYDNIWDALQSEEQGDLIMEFINQFLGRNDVTRENVAVCVREALKDTNDSTTAILPASPGNMDNSLLSR
jgi:hypothetical protein